MDTIKITQASDNTFHVSIFSGTPTEHTVRVEQKYYQKLTGGRTSAEELVHKSFEFLLEREPNTSILRSFELSVIARYFPEYEHWIKSRFIKD
jgi:hypothetical protein